MARQKAVNASNDIVRAPTRFRITVDLADIWNRPSIFGSYVISAAYKANL